jgi:mannose-6-phosphate isomerase-like protein (cupin superfamily)
MKDQDISPFVKSTLWRDVEQEMPDSDTTVMIHNPGADEPVWLGYNDGEIWREVSGKAIRKGRVKHWAEIIEGPSVKSAKSVVKP